MGNKGSSEMRIMIVIAMLLAVSACTSLVSPKKEMVTVDTNVQREVGIITALSDNGCLVKQFNTSKGVGSRATITVHCVHLELPKSSTRNRPDIFNPLPAVIARPDRSTRR